MSLLPDWLTGYDAANADAAAAADAKLRELNAIDYGPGGKFYTPENAVIVGNDYAKQDATNPMGQDAQRAQIDQAFTDSLASSAKKYVGDPLAILWELIKKILGALPWWIWAVALVVVFFWLGGFTWLRGILAKKKS